MSEVNNEMTEEERREQARAELLAKIAELQALIEKLNEYKEQLSEQEEKTRSEVLGPESEYDLTAATDIKHWAGDLEQTGEEKQGAIAEALDGFCGQIEEVIGEINKVIEKIQEEIDDLQAQLDAL